MSEKEKQEEKPRYRTASRYVYWLAMLALERPYEAPQIGDWVIEATHIIGLARHRLGFEDAVGKLLEADRAKSVYVIETLEGRTHRWENAYFRVLEKAQPEQPKQQEEKP